MAVTTGVCGIQLTGKVCLGLKSGTEGTLESQSAVLLHVPFCLCDDSLSHQACMMCLMKVKPEEECNISFLL